MKPLIGLPADRCMHENHWTHTVGEKYLLAVIDIAAGVPVMLPALGPHASPLAALDHLDGLLITGAHSNIEPHHYGQEPVDDSDARDTWRDATNLALIPAAIERGIPVLGICRGLQELNVALGGSLHQRVHQVTDRFDHREDPTGTLEEQYGPAHPVSVCGGGLLAQWAGCDQITVNSVHGQGIDRLATGLQVEARALDGLVEAVSAPAAAGFVFAVQWHPEWKAAADPISVAIFSAFGAACRRYAAARHAGAHAQSQAPS